MSGAGSPKRIGRRLAMAALGGVAVHRAARAQATLPTVVVLEPGPTLGVGSAAFVDRLEELGWVNGRTVRIERRFGNWDAARIEAQAHEAVAGSPRLVIAHSIPGVRAALAATRSIPVVGMTADMVAEGFVGGLTAPASNLTGVTLIQRELDLKRLELLREASPRILRVGFLVVPTTPAEHVAGLAAEAGRLGLEIEPVAVADAGAIDAVMARIAARSVDGVLMQNTALLSREGLAIAQAALRHRLPSISESPLYAERGGLLQYGADIPGMFRQMAAQADKILRGARPNQVPIEQPARIVLVVNQRSATTLGLELPPTLVARADEVIE